MASGGGDVVETGASASQTAPNLLFLADTILLEQAIVHSVMDFPKAWFSLSPCSKGREEPCSYPDCHLLCVTSERKGGRK